MTADGVMSPDKIGNVPRRGHVKRAYSVLISMMVPKFQIVSFILYVLPRMLYVCTELRDFFMGSAFLK